MYAKNPEDVKWFSSVDTVAEVKALYRELALKYHPDRGGDTVVMAVVNRQYAAALRALDGRKRTGADGEAHVYRYDETRERDVVRVLDALLAMRMEQVDIFLIGTFVWVVGRTRPHGKRLLELGLLWHDKRRCWYWKPVGAARSFYSGADFGILAEQYGCRHFTCDNPHALQVA